MFSIQVMIQQLGHLVAALMPAVGLSYDAALAEAPVHPSVIAHEARTEARGEHDRLIGWLTQRTLLSLSPGYRFASSQDRGIEGVLGLNHGWNLADLAGARRSAAKNERALLAAEQAALLQSIELGIARRWIELHRSEAVEALVAARVRRADALRDHLLDALKATGGTRREQAKVELYAAELARQALQAKAERFHAQVRLAEALGRTMSGEVHTKGVGPNAPPAGGLEVCLRRSASLVVAEARVRAAAARQRETSAQSATVLSTGLSIQRESPDGWIGFVNLGVTLPGSAVQARAESQASAEAAAERATVPGVIRAVQRYVALIRHEMEHAREEIALLDGRLAKAARAMVDAQRDGFAAGEVTVLALRRAEKDFLLVERDQLHARAELTWAYAQAQLFARHCPKGTP